MGSAVPRGASPGAGSGAPSGSRALVGRAATTDPARPAGPARPRLVARRVPFDAIPRAAWDRLLALTGRATPFSRWTFHRAWWDAYGPAAHEDYMVCVEDGATTHGPAAIPAGPGVIAPDPGAATPGPAALDPATIVAIVPLMHRHEVEPDDLALHTAIRHEHDPLTRVPGQAKAVFFAASYHADYATILCDPSHLPGVAAAVVAELAAGPDEHHGPSDWDVVDLRRLRADDPALDALESAFRAAAPDHGWAVWREQEEVCPVLRTDATDLEAYLGTLSAKERHEVRRKLRRLEAAGRVEFEQVTDPASFVDEFIALHQARWGDEGLFPDTEGGARSRRFFRRLAELEGPGGALGIGRLAVDGRAIFMCAGFHQDSTTYYYNAGNDPEAQHLSPGVVGVAYYLRDRLEQGYRVFDFLRGDEAYKYRWGAVDEPIHRLLVTRTAGDEPTSPTDRPMIGPDAAR